MSNRVGIINCPACGKEMVEIFMPEQGINLDVCLNGCGGIYFDNREFKHFDTSSQNIDKLIEVTKDKNFITVDDTLQRTCPVCHAKMVKNFSSAKKQVLVDECYFCGGKFLDYKELLKIRAEEEYSDAMLTICSIAGVDFNDKKRANDPVRKLFDSLIKEK